MSESEDRTEDKIEEENAPTEDHTGSSENKENEEWR